MNVPMIYSMIYPIFAVFVLTFIIGVIAVVLRFRSVKQGNVKIKYYRTMQGQEVPEIIIKSTRCFNNMFEVPVLFYVGAVLFVSLGLTNTIALYAAWAFVVFRVIHTFIHLTYNNVLHRMLFFWFGVIAVLVMWVSLMVKIS